MLQQAMQKLQAEINNAEKSKKDVISVIGSFLMDRIRSHPEESEKILVEGKTIAGGYKTIEDEANKRRASVIAPDVGFNLVLKYYGITVSEEVPAVAPAPAISTSLDDLF